MATIHPFPTPPEPATEPAPPPPGPHPWGAARLAPIPPTGTAYTLVDGIAQSDHPPAPAERRHTDLPPVIATWLRTSEGRRNAASEAARRTRYRAGFHGLRMPVYVLRIARRSPWGLWAALRLLGLWVIDREGTESIRALRAGGISGNLQSLEDTHRAAVKFRVLGVAAALILAPIGWFVALAFLATAWPPALWLWGAGTPAATVLILGWVGRHPDKRIIERVVFNGSEVPKLTQDLVVHALAMARIPGFDKHWKTDGAKCVRWQKPPTRTRNGYECVLDFPAGVTVDDAAGRTQSVASGLSRPSSTVWLNSIPEEQGGHDARLHLVVTDRPMRMAPMPAWSLAEPDAGKFDMFGKLDFGVDYLGDPAYVRFMFRSWVIGALPRMGKSFTLREALTAAALDPTCELHIYDLKGGADFLDFMLPGTAVAHAFRSGSSAEDATAMLADLRGMKRDMESRYTTVRKLTTEHPERIPEGKITRDLANDKTLGLHPKVLAIDETQVCFVDWPDRKEFIALVTDLAKRGPAVGIMVWLATQSVDSKTIPTSISRMAGLRWCMRVTDHVASEQILGTGTHAKGYAPDRLSLDDMGIGYLTGEGDTTKLVRCHLVTKVPGEGAQLIPLLQKARAQREATGWLTGIAAGETDTLDDDLGGVVDHVLEVWPTGQPAVHADVLCGLLAERWPTMYGGWGPTELASALGPSGIKSRQLNTFNPKANKVVNRQGYDLERFGDYLERRDAELDLDAELEDLEDD